MDLPFRKTAHFRYLQKRAAAPKHNLKNRSVSAARSLEFNPDRVLSGGSQQIRNSFGIDIPFAGRFPSRI
jgi:hypothetical protein